MAQGRPVLTETWDREALAGVARAHGLDLVVLFGSTARGRRRADSDFDVAIRFAEPWEQPPTFEEEAKVEAALDRVLRPRCELDAVWLHRASPLLLANVAQDGVLLYGADEGVWPWFQIRAHRVFEDTARLRHRRWHVVRWRLGLMPPLDENLKEKVASLSGYADELEAWLTQPPEPVGPRALQRVVERLVQVIVECATDAGDLWLALQGHSVGDTAREVFRGLKDAGAIPADLENRFASHIADRNRIVHDYDRLDADAILRHAAALPSDTRELLRALAAE